MSARGGGAVSTAREIEPSLWKPLPWDSDFFRLRVALVQPPEAREERLAQALAELRGWRADLAYLLLDADADVDMQLAERCGFHLVDLRLTLEHDMRAVWLPEPRPDQAAPAIRLYRGEDLPALGAIARTAFHATRFYVDTRIPRDRADALYQTWVERSCASDAEHVLVAERAGEPAGFITCRSERGAREGQIGLFAVSPEHAGAGAGSALIQAALAWARERELTRLVVVTQGRNLRAQRLYQRAGFLSTRMQFWYHRWFAA